MGTWATSTGRRPQALRCLMAIGCVAICVLVSCSVAETPSSDSGSSFGPGISITAGTSSFGGSVMGACDAGPLGARCDGQPCPPSETEVALECGAGDVFPVTYRYDTDCGGVAVEHNYGTSNERWYFDASGALVGASTFDGASSCMLPSGATVTSAWGTLCLPLMPGRDLCKEACPAQRCVPQATILADFPVQLADAATRDLMVCRNAECLRGYIPPDLELGQGIGFESATGQLLAAGQTLRAWLSPGSTTPFALSLTWTLESGDFAADERYLAYLESQVEGGPALPIFDTVLAFESLDLGCAGMCRVGDVDLRAEAP